MNRTVDVASSWAASVVRGFNGYAVKNVGRRPVRPLELFEFEGCPYCRLVRDALSELDLDARIFPCPKGGTRFRAEAERIGGKAQFPFLVDPNTGRSLYESKDIVAYLFEQYGSGTVPLGKRLLPIQRLTSALASVARRPIAPSRAVPSVAPREPLELWSFEASPYCRLPREALCRLEIPYVLHNVAKKSAHRTAFVERSGRMMVPYLADPNTGKEMFESADIVRYLYATYGAKTG